MLHECDDLPTKNYHVELLSYIDAMQILCRDSVMRVNKEKDLETIVKGCRGIPLVLKIVAADLHKQNYDRDRCKGIIEKLNQCSDIKDQHLSNHLIHFVCKELKEETREAFLDICCFLGTEHSRREVEYIVGVEEVTFLIDAALITPVMVPDPTLWKEQEEVLTVHDIILSIGRRLAMSSRIVGKKGWAEAENDEARLREIKAVDGRYLIGQYTLEERHLKYLKKNLRILEWYGHVHVKDTVALSKLRKLMIGHDISWLNIEALYKLAVLYCPYKLRPVPTEERKLKLPESLRTLHIRYQHELQNIVPNSSLEELIVERAYLTHKDNSTQVSLLQGVFNTFLQGLNSLKFLQILAMSFTELPEQVCKLPQLRRLLIESCLIKRLLKLFGQLTTLTHFSLALCDDLQELPDEIGQLKSLHWLCITNCSRFRELPDTIGQLKSLQCLSIKGCSSFRKLPDEIGQLKSLQYLHLSQCDSLSKLPKTIGQLESLQYLDLSYCSRLEQLPLEIEQLGSLEVLDLRNCPDLKSDICQKDGYIKKVERRLHFCSECHKDKKLKVLIDPTIGGLPNM